MRTSHKIVFIIIFAIIAIVTMVVMVKIYRDNNPLESNKFPKCSFYVTTGYKCPGCGCQRAIHYLLNGEFVESFRQNPLFHVGITYIITVLVLRLPWLNPKFSQLHDTLTGYWACVLWLVGIIAFGVLRNVL